MTTMTKLLAMWAYRGTLAPMLFSNVVSAITSNVIGMIMAIVGHVGRICFKALLCHLPDETEQSDKIGQSLYPITYNVTKDRSVHVGSITETQAASINLIASRLRRVY
jgi:hypothetical protein